ncbi:unnamed protein product, partial [Rotaria sp. Silwood2]
GLFKYVHEISLFDEHHFEHEFFIRIAQSFPFLKVLSINNWTSQKHKSSRTLNNDNKHFTIIKYPHLIKLYLYCVNVNYVEQFLDHRKTAISNNMSLFIEYRHLRKATYNFTRDDMRVNCSKLSEIHIMGPYKISERLKGYFPYVKGL